MSNKRKSDIIFLKEMLDRLVKAPHDTTQYEYIKTMIKDWIKELQEGEK